MFNKGKITELVRFDWFIKFIFRNKSDFDILEGFLSELLKDDIKILEILERGQQATVVSSKKCQLTIKTVS